MEDESDFHLQRAEPDILSGAHSSNFFNNRDSKDSQDTPKIGGQTRNQVEPQKRKVVKKLQRRPTESTYEPSSTQRQITNNFAGSYGPTTTRPTTGRTTAQEQQYSESYNNKQNYNTYQSPKQVSSTQAPDFGKISVSTYNQADYQKTEQSTTQKINRVYNQRQPSTPDYRSYSEGTVNYNNKQSTFNNEAFNQNPVSNTESRNYNADNQNNYRTTPQPARRVVSRQRGQQTYRNQQTSNGNHNSETSPQSYDTSVQYNANQNNNNNNYNYNNNRNSQPTQRYNNDQSSANQYDNSKKNVNNQETTYQIKYSSPSTTQQTTAKYNNDYNKKQTSQYNNNYNNEDTQDFGKIKSSPKYEEKKITTKSPAKTNNFENQYNGSPQTPAPKFNTNLLYDNNQQSTPDYYKTDYNNQDSKTSNSPASTKSQQSSSAGTSGSDFYKNQPKSQYSTPQPFSYNQGVSQSSEPKSKANIQTYSTSQPSPFAQNAGQSQKSYEQKYTDDAQKTSTSQPSAFAQGNSQNYKFNEPSTAHIQKISTAQPSQFPSQAASYNQQPYQQNPTANVQQYSTAQPSSFNQAGNYNQKPTANIQQYSTAYPTNYNQGASNQNSYDQKSTQNVQQYQPTTGRSTSQNNQRSEAKHQAPSYKQSKPQDYDDGQYRPEVHERESGGEYDVTVRQPTRKEEFYDAQQEGEFLKTAHSINIAASGNQLARDRARAQTSGPTSTKTAVYQQSQVTTQLPPRRIQTTVAPRSASSILPVSITSTQPRPFSIRVPDTPAPISKKFIESKASSSSLAKPFLSPEVKPASAPQTKFAPSPQAKQAHLSSRPAQQSQPKATQKAKDVSYDYAYYDNSDHSDHYSEYDNIEEFGRTSKRQ